MNECVTSGNELWDTESRNLVGDYDTQAEALVVARELIELNGTIYPAALALVQVGPDGRTATLATGESLAMLVQQVVGKPVFRSA